MCVSNVLFPIWMGRWVETCSAANISESTRNILLLAWRRKNTISANSSAWNKWISWCDSREFNPVSATLGSVLEFSKEQFENKKAYRTLNVYGSSLSILLPEIDSHKVVLHPLVSQYLKGIFHLKPPSPNTWDVTKTTLPIYIKTRSPIAYQPRCTINTRTFQKIYF